MDTPEQRLEPQISQELQKRSFGAPKPDGGRHEQLVTAICEGMIPVAKKHLVREIGEATEPLGRRIAQLERRIAELESKQRAVKSAGLKAIGRRPVKCF